MMYDVGAPVLFEGVMQGGGTLLCYTRKSGFVFSIASPEALMQRGSGHHCTASFLQQCGVCVLRTGCMCCCWVNGSILCGQWCLGRCIDILYMLRNGAIPATSVLH